MSYQDKITALQKKVEEVSKLMQEAATNNNQEQYKELIVKKISLQEEINKLHKSKWEEMHDTFNMDEY